jgi:hypothetical protein
MHVDITSKADFLLGGVVTENTLHIESFDRC